MTMRVHLIGVCGTAMATLAAMLKRKGFDVRGSDQDVYPPMSDFLAAEGIKTFSGYHPEHITSDLDLVIAGNAISRGNPELEEVLDRKIRYCSLPEMIREHFLWGARSIVIAGTHGKTTTTALSGWVLTDSGADPSVLVGGIVRNFGEHGSSYRMGQGRDFVIEGDEYDSAFFDKTAKFLKYLPDIAVVNNVEFDHADIYADIDAVSLSFRRLVNLVPRKGLLLIGADSPRALALREFGKSRIETFGTADGTDWQAHDIKSAGASTLFKVRRRGEIFGEFELPLLGVHNVRNALAALAIATEVGVDHERIRAAMKRFSGVKRRLEVVGTADGVTVYDDFAHHPTAVNENTGRLACVEPGRADLGDLRTSFGGIMPQSLSGRLRAGLRRRQRGTPRSGLPVVAAGRSAALGAAARSRSASTRSVRTGNCLNRRNHQHRGQRAPAWRPRLDDVERRLWRHSRPPVASARR